MATVKSVAENAIQEVKEEKAKIEKAVKKTAEKVEKAAAPAKKAAKEATAKVEKAAKEVAEKKLSKKLTDAAMFFEFGGKQVNKQDILTAIEEDYVAAGHKLTSIKSMQIYVKAEDRAAYYVVNDAINGKVDL